MKWGIFMSESKKQPRRLDNNVTAKLKRVPYEKTPAHWLEKHRDLLEQRESARVEEERKAREATKNIVIGGPFDKTNEC